MGDVKHPFLIRIVDAGYFIELSKIINHPFPAFTSMLKRYEFLNCVSKYKDLTLPGSLSNKLLS